MIIIEFIKALILGIVEGLTEFAPFIYWTYDSCR